MHGDHKSSKHRELMEKVGEVKENSLFFFSYLLQNMILKVVFYGYLLLRQRPSSGSQCRRKEMLKILRDRFVEHLESIEQFEYHEPLKHGVEFIFLL